MRNTEAWSGILMGAIALLFYVFQARNWHTLHPYRRLGILVGMGTAVLAAVVSSLDIPWVGRYVLASILSGFIVYAFLYRLSLSRYERTLSAFAATVQMRVIRTPTEESSDPDLFGLRKWYGQGHLQVEGSRHLSRSSQERTDGFTS